VTSRTPAMRALHVFPFGKLFVCLNGPATAILLMSRIPRPELLSVTGCGGLVVKITWYGNVRLVGENVTAGGVPTPVSGTVCGLAGALSATLTAAFLVPVAVGEKVTHFRSVLYGQSARQQGA
jgi:hypothetical protein